MYLHARDIPFKTFQDAARYGFLRTNELPAFRDWDPTDSAAVRAHRRARRVENNEYFLGCYLQFVNLNVMGQSDSLHKYSIRPSLIIDGKPSHTYTVKKKVYFMMGDNRDRSSDSRYWGMLSKDFVKAKAFIIYFSYDGEPGGSLIRWTRIGKLID